MTCADRRRLVPPTSACPADSPAELAALPPCGRCCDPVLWLAAAAPRAAVDAPPWLLLAGLGLTPLLFGVPPPSSSPPSSAGGGSVPVSFTV